MSNPHNPETQTLSERIPDEQFYGFLNGVGNHEAKLLTAAVILSQPGRWFNQNDVYRQIIDHQGQPVAWRMGQPMPWGYCRDSLAPIGAVLVGQNEKDQPAYMADETTREINLAATGLLLDWSVSNPDISLQAIFGSTSSTGNVRSPETRYQIYLDLLSGNEGVSETEIFESLGGLGYAHDESLNSQLRAMEDRGLILVESKFKEYNPAFRIDEEFRTRPAVRSDAQKEVRAIYVALDQLGQTTNVCNLDDILDLAKQVDPSIDILQARSKLVSAASYDRLPGLALEGKGLMTKGHKTLIRLNPDFAAPIQNLCQRLERLKDGHDIGHYSALAEQIINDPALFRLIINKANKSSPYVAGHSAGREVLDSDVLSLIRKLGSATVRVVQEQLKETQGRNLSVDHVRRILNELAGRDQVEVSHGSTDPKSKRKLKVYSSKP